MMWDVFAWVGIATLVVLAFRAVHFAAESFIVSRVGWEHLSALGFWRSLLASFADRTEPKGPR